MEKHTVVVEQSDGSSQAEPVSYFSRDQLGRSVVSKGAHAVRIVWIGLLGLVISAIGLFLTPTLYGALGVGVGNWTNGVSMAVCIIVMLVGTLMASSWKEHHQWSGHIMSTFAAGVFMAPVIHGWLDVGFVDKIKLAVYITLLMLLLFAFIGYFFGHVMKRWMYFTVTGLWILILWQTGHIIGMWMGFEMAYNIMPVTYAGIGLFSLFPAVLFANATDDSEDGYPFTFSNALAAGHCFSYCGLNLFIRLATGFIR